MFPSTCILIQDRSLYCTLDNEQQARQQKILRRRSTEQVTMHESKGYRQRSAIAAPTTTLARREAISARPPPSPEKTQTPPCFLLVETAYMYW